MAKALTKGSRITGPQRATLAGQYADRYAAGESIRQIAASIGRSFGFVHGVLVESGVTLRSRGGVTRGPKRSGPDPSPKTAPAQQAPTEKTPTEKTPTEKTPAEKAPAPLR